MRRLLIASAALNVLFAAFAVFQHVALTGAADRSLALAREAVDAHGECVELVRKERAEARRAWDWVYVYRGIRDTAAVPYANPGANCLDHSRLLVGRLAEQGISSYIAVSRDRSHAWVLVSVEPTPGYPWSGAPVPAGRDPEILEVRDGSLNVVLD